MLRTASVPLHPEEMMEPLPPLDIDKILGRPAPRRRLEQRIAWRLFQDLAAAGFPVVSVDDGDEVQLVADAKAAMELLFNLDDAWVNFKGRRAVRFVFGNSGDDCISDWRYATGDADGFNAAMERITTAIEAEGL